MQSKDWFYLILGLLCVIVLDFFLLGFFQQQIAFLALAYCMIHMITTHSRLAFCVLMIALVIESLVFYGHPALMLVYAIPCALLGRKMLQVINAPMAVCAVCVTGAIVIQMQIVDRYLLNRPPVCWRYTIISIGVTLIAVLVYYLKDKIR